MKKERQLICGVGVNDADYPTQPTINGKSRSCPFYQRWHSMLKRCYSAKFQETNPTYIGCSVTEEWLTFSAFRNWMLTQSWEGKELDKDILVVGNKVYSPDTAVFIDARINSFLNERSAARGENLIGVCWDKGCKIFKAYVRHEGRKIHLGSFNNELDAHLIYSQAKATVIYKAAVNQSDPRVKDALIKRADKLSRLSEIREAYEQRQLLAA